ncbi:hypothetical protein Tco_0757411 [Tanacetum coccineum]
MSRQKKTMCTYMKNMAGYKMEHFKGKSFYKVKEMFDNVYKHVTSFVPMDSIMEKERTKRAGLNLQEESLKRQKTREGSKPTEELKADEISQEDLQQMIMVVPVEEVYVKALQKFDIDDLDKLWSLVKERFSSTDPTNDKGRTLWVELKRGTRRANHISTISWIRAVHLVDPWEELGQKLSFNGELCQLLHVMTENWEEEDGDLAQMFGCLARVRMDSGNNEMVCVVVWNGANLFQVEADVDLKAEEEDEDDAEYSPFVDAFGLSPTCADMRVYTWAAQDHTVEWKRHKLLEMRLRKRLWSIVKALKRQGKFQLPSGLASIIVIDLENKDLNSFSFLYVIIEPKKRIGEWPKRQG